MLHDFGVACFRVRIKRKFMLDDFIYCASVMDNADVEKNV